MANRILLRQDNSENWEKYNPTLMQGEPAFDTSTRRMKIGDGFHRWKSLPFVKIGSQFFNYYVSSEGDDTWDGDEGAPLRTIGKALELASRNSYTENEIVVGEMTENYIELGYKEGKVQVGDYFTSNVGYGFVVDLHEGEMLVWGSFTTEVPPTYYTVSRRSTILCKGAHVVTTRLEVPPFVEIVNEGFLFVGGGSFRLPQFSLFSFTNRGSVFCQDNSLFITSEEVTNNVSIELGMSQGMNIAIDSLRLSVNDTLTPSECNVSGNYGHLEMDGTFTSYLEVESESSVFQGNYRLSGTVGGSVSLNGRCSVPAGEKLTIGSEGKTSVVLCCVEGDLQKVGTVRDINSLT